MQLSPDTPGYTEWHAINANRVAKGEPELPWPDFPAVLETEQDVERLRKALDELAAYAPTPEPSADETGEELPDAAAGQ